MAHGLSRSQELDPVPHGVAIVAVLHLDVALGSVGDDVLEAWSLPMSCLDPLAVAWDG